MHHSYITTGHVHLRMTNQFANDLWWYHQLLISPLRVTSYDEADVVFVPGMFARGDPFTEQDMHRHFVEFFQEYVVVDGQCVFEFCCLQQMH